MKTNYFFNVLLLTLITLTSCTNSKPEELDIVRLNRSLNMSYAPIFLAEEAGYFTEYGIELEMVDFERTAEAIPLVISGDLDVYAGAINAGILNTLFNEPTIRIVADRGKVTREMDCTYQGILVRRDLFESGIVTKPEDLAGLTIVSSAAGPAAFLLSDYLAQGGLTLEDVAVNDLPPAAFVDSMSNGTVDLIVTIELNLSRVLAAGESVLLTSAEDVLGDFQTSVLAFGKNLLVDDPELGARFLAAYLKGVALYNEGKTNRNLQVLAEITGEEVGVLKNACWLPISKDGVPDFNSVVPFMNWSIEQGHLDQAITEDQFWTPSFLDSAKALISQ